MDSSKILPVSTEIKEAKNEYKLVLVEGSRTAELYHRKEKLRAAIESIFNEMALLLLEKEINRVFFVALTQKRKYAAASIALQKRLYLLS